MNEQQNLILGKKFFEEIYNKGDLNQLEQLCANDIKLRDPAMPNFKGGLKGLRDNETMYKNAFPNKNLKVDNIFAAQNVVCAHWTCQGTQKGTFCGKPATNKNFKISGITILHINNNKITEIDQIWDRLSLFEQLGFIEHIELALR